MTDYTVAELVFRTQKSKPCKLYILLYINLKKELKILVLINPENPIWVFFT